MREDASNANPVFGQDPDKLNLEARGQESTATVLSAKIDQEKAKLAELLEAVEKEKEKEAQAAERAEERKQRAEEKTERERKRAEQDALKMQEAENKADDANAKLNDDMARAGGALLLDDLKILEKETEEEKKQTEEEIKRSDLRTRNAMQGAVSKNTEQQSVVKEEAAVGRISPEQEASDLQALIAQKLEIQNSYYLALEELYSRDSIEWQKIEDQRLAAVRKSAAEQLSVQEDLDRRKMRSWEQATSRMNQEFIGSVNSILRGQDTIAQGAARMANNMLLSFVDSMLQQVLKHEQAKEIELLQEAAHWVKVNLLHIQSNAVTTASDATAAAAKQATTIATNVAAVVSYAGVAAAAAMASTAAIPIVGPELAPGVAAATLAATLGFGALASAAGGWGEIPGDTIAAVHKKEMILPAPLAGGIREMIASGGGRAQQSSTVYMNNRVNQNFTNPKASSARETRASIQNLARRGKLNLG